MNPNRLLLVAGFRVLNHNSACKRLLPRISRSLATKALNAFGDPIIAAQWLCYPNANLQDECPLEWIKVTGSDARVIHLLDERIAAAKR